MGDYLVDVQRGFVEEAGDVLGDGFVLVRQRGQGFQVMAEAEGVLLDCLDVRQGLTEAEVDPLAAGRGVGTDDGEGQGLVPAGFDLGDGRLGHAQSLGDVGLRELGPATQARQAIGDAGVLHELGVGALHLLAQAFAFDEIFDLGVGPGGRLGGRAAT